MKRTGGYAQRGDSLIEVMIALSLTAITALGVVGLQGALARGERAALLRERAALVSQLQARAASMLPAGDVSIADRSDGIHVAILSWRAEDRSDACPEPQSKPLTSCIAVAFAR
ncbi:MULTISPECIES: prepilin-type N-terminal cleavage/methylation domain-containing protein [unclassified Caballeronia]|uniref:type IV pilus modification PilV family protein n=1 Tax=unclassified Caballeronia TaxID=2646786 RepID=UPI001F229292|nr:MULTISPECIES: prepilin-type N-terminal cleavage/methylation domain-containing protein [unclassified Caballeronia]MCE4540827.1 prepilin-type N-terminal cleavage/methylation domain-containing protein [Caballeronia sp. PC1]MCE4570130.1 prepilin-type N-terminal cleavage/methylation domain-containing protein [Caballeronia sp. CLC5]